MSEGLQKAIDLCKAGKKADARSLLLQIVRDEPDNEQAWGWFSHVAQSEAERVGSLRQVLRINPQNAAVRKIVDEYDRNDWARPPQPQARPRPVPTAPVRPAPTKDHGSRFPWWAWLTVGLVGAVVLIALVSIVVLKLLPSLTSTQTNSSPAGSGTGPVSTIPAGGIQVGNNGLRVLPEGSALQDGIWSLKVSRVEVVTSITFSDRTDWSKQGRFAIVHLLGTNMSPGTDMLIAPVGAVLVDDKGHYEVQGGESATAAFSENMDFGVQLHPTQTGEVLAVFDLPPSTWTKYLLLIYPSNTGLLLDVPIN